MGLRRTKDGWEDATMWHVRADGSPESIDEWIDRQRQLEPGWMRLMFDRIRMTPPLMVAVIQITAIAAITAIAQACPNRSQLGLPESKESRAVQNESNHNL